MWSSTSLPITNTSPDLEKDNDFLKKGGVFTDDVIEMWLSYKRAKEVDALRLRPHPYEFFLYYDI
jgi:glutamine synthetase